MGPEAGWRRQLPFIDAGAAFCAGVVVLLLRDWLSGAYGFPPETVTFLGMVNLGYSVIGFTLGLRRSRVHLWVLIAANLFWAVACGVLTVRLAEVGTPFGLGVLLFEGAFVVTLAALEWRHRRAILTRR